ncbi:MAG TPA: DUF4388 domain-containing protein [Anaerolineae bacterium]|nr:DUF4388 domain-containing protein [Anaerolineae bacterium]HQE98452.1 DUF4388 domain-containing protein [Anaerolineae bacterium]HQJ11163.1 DUF4388 domain-containing protein [Anaerolineae bacterium]HUM37102.1 DUF4388 domain-containing protein [Anaerolineae bacterium]
MALQGTLGDLSLSDLIQLHCQAGSTARLTIQKASGESGRLYFEGGEIVHAEGEGLQGSEAVYALLTWQEGSFEVDQNTAAPTRTIRMPWSAVLMEGLRRADERRRHENSSKNQEGIMAGENRRERLAQILSQLVESSGDVRGAAVVGRDGLIIAAHLPAKMEQARVGAVAAALLSLSGRSIGQLERGEFQQTLIQGTEGNVLITDAGKNAVFVALTGKDVNLGMVFLEVREAAGAVAEILS